MNWPIIGIDSIVLEKQQILQVSSLHVVNCRLSLSRSGTPWQDSLHLSPYEGKALAQTKAQAYTP